MRPPLIPVLLVALGTTSCFGLGGSPPEIHRHSIGLFEIEKVCEEPVFPSIAVRNFEGRQRYEARVLVIDESDGTLSYYENERWLEDPRDALTDVVREGLAISGAFEVVGPVTSGFIADYILDGTVLECDVIKTTSGPWRARLALRLDAARVENSEMLNAAVYRAERDLPAADVHGVGRAMTACAKEITENAGRDWLESAPPENRIDTPR